MATTPEESQMVIEEFKQAMGVFGSALNKNKAKCSVAQPATSTAPSSIPFAKSGPYSQAMFKFSQPKSWAPKKPSPKKTNKKSGKLTSSQALNFSPVS